VKTIKPLHGWLNTFPAIVTDAGNGKWLVCDGNTRLTEIEFILAHSISTMTVGEVNHLYPASLCRGLADALNTSLIPCIVLKRNTPMHIVLTVGVGKKC
jgi:hypothetical protein